MSNADRENVSLDFDLRGSRLEMIGQIVNTVRKTRLLLNRHQNEEKLRDYYAALDELRMEILPYIEEKEEREKLEGILKGIDPELKNTDEKVKHLSGTDLQNAKREISQKMDKLEKLDRKLNRKRISIGLDIPKETQIEDGKEMME